MLRSALAASIVWLTAAPAGSTQSRQEPPVFGSRGLARHRARLRDRQVGPRRSRPHGRGLRSRGPGQEGTDLAFLPVDGAPAGATKPARGCRRRRAASSSFSSTSCSRRRPASCARGKPRHLRPRVARAERSRGSRDLRPVGSPGARHLHPGVTRSRRDRWSGAGGDAAAPARPAEHRLRPSGVPRWGPGIGPPPADTRSAPMAELPAPDGAARWLAPDQESLSDGGSRASSQGSDVARADARLRAGKKAADPALGGLRLDRARRRARAGVARDFRGGA